VRLQKRSSEWSGNCVLILAQESHGPSFASRGRLIQRAVISCFPTAMRESAVHRGGDAPVTGQKLIRESNMSEQTKSTIVFAHGLWADGSCYSKIVADDAASVRTSLARANGPVVLVGHSYGALYASLEFKSYNQGCLTLLVLMTGPYSLNCSASWLSKALCRPPLERKRKCIRVPQRARRHRLL
jgi:pimeloyl-ACP methyl ester carboxylesterase